MDGKTIEKGDLFFLTHADTPLFSGYGLARVPGSKQHLMGLLLVDRPHRASPAWLAEVRNAFSPFDLYPMTMSGERGIAFFTGYALWAPIEVNQPVGGYRIYALLSESMNDIAALYPKRQAELAQFAELWARNTRAQGWLDADPVKCVPFYCDENYNIDNRAIMKIIATDRNAEFVCPPRTDKQE